MKISVVSYSLSEDPGTLTEWRTKLVTAIQGFIDSGSDVILYPELFLMGLTKYFDGNEIESVASYVHQELLPGLTFSRDVMVVLGSGPRFSNGRCFNSAPVWVNQKWHFQDKLFLTPWETDFTPGFESNIFSFKGLKTAVVICYDSEQPDLAMKLKEEGIDLMLVPSATTNLNGSSRVNRCSSGRAIELGAVVVTAPLVGNSKCELVDHNEGRQGFFLPAQDDVNVPQETFSAYSTKKSVIGTYDIDVEMLRKVKAKTSETKPFHKEFHPSLILKKIQHTC